MDGSTCRLALLADRAERRGLGPIRTRRSSTPCIARWRSGRGEQRGDLVKYVAARDLFEDPRFWKLAQALFEVMPRDGEDWKLVMALLGERDTLRAEARQAGERTSAPPGLFEETP